MSREHKSRFEWLQDYLELDDEIRYLEWKIRKSNAEVDRWSEGDLSRLHVSGSDSRAAHVGEEVPELQTKLTECKAEQYDLLKLIDSFSGYENQILKMKYVQGKSLEEIAAFDKHPCHSFDHKLSVIYILFGPLQSETVQAWCF